ncbi:MAG: sulfatase [Dehalococcoidia bacterium]|nr:sulfatase [Dehalococcoidia bacterium]
MKDVILLTIDALRKDALGCYGRGKELTPFIDSLQSQCIRFTRGQATGPYTQASFPGILTSSYYLEYGKPKGLSPHRTLVSEPLKQAGIVTAAFHSNPYLCDFLGWNRGWDFFYDSMEEEVSSRMPYIKGNVINAKVTEWLSSYSAAGDGKPFFLWLHYMDIHEPYIPERKYVDMVDSSITMSQDEMYSLFENTLLKRDVSDPEKVTLLKKLYDMHVREVDTYVQDFFNTLDQLGILKDSVVIMTSDHGDEFNEHGSLSHDDKMNSELIDIPLIIYGAGKNGICDTLVSNADIPPTIVHLFGLDPVKKFEGHSLLPLDGYPEKGCFGEAIDQRGQRGGDIEKDSYFYREKDLKIICHAGVDRWELYDLNQDPNEVNNIIDTSPAAEELRSKLKPRMRRWLS